MKAFHLLIIFEVSHKKKRQKKKKSLNYVTKLFGLETDVLCLDLNKITNLNNICLQ